MSASPRKMSSSTCNTTRKILDRVGDKWSLLIIGTLSDGDRRFNELGRSIEGISQRMLTLTLKTLERDGLVSRRVTPTVPPRVDYALTPLGKTLLPPVMAIWKWAQANEQKIAVAQQAFDEKRRKGLNI